MSTHPVKQFIDTALASQKPLTTVLGAVKRGELKYEEVKDYFASEYKPVMLEHFKKFGNGLLFAAQVETFPVWLEAKSHRKDVERWMAVKSDVWMAGMKETDKVMEPIVSFVSARIYYPSISERKAILEASGSPYYNEALRRWAHTNQHHGWNWRGNGNFQ